MATGGVWNDETNDFSIAYHNLRSNEDLFKSSYTFEKKQDAYFEKWALSKLNDVEIPWIRFVMPKYEKLITFYPAWWFSEKNDEENQNKILEVSIKNKKIKTKASKPRRNPHKF
jgi:hypothetical protein